MVDSGLVCFSAHLIDDYFLFTSSFKNSIHIETFCFVIDHSYQQETFRLQVKELLDDAHSISRAVNSVANSSGVGEDFVVVATRVGLVTKEVDVLVFDAAVLGVFFKVAEAVGLVPASGEDVEGDLTANGEAIENQAVSNCWRQSLGYYSRQAKVAKLLAQDRNKGLTDLGGLVVGLEVMTLLVAGVTANRADVHHAVAELDKGATLDGNIEIGNVVQAEVGKLLPLVLANPLDEAVGGELLAELEGSQAVL